MLQPAKMYEKELQELKLKTFFNPKYKWCYLGYNMEIPIYNSRWEYIQMVSVIENKVIGFLEASMDRPEGFVSKIFMVNFTEDKRFFIDIKNFLEYLIYEVEVLKIDFSVIVGNPIEKKYDHLIKKFGGKIIGTMKGNVLIGSKYYDQKLYEFINDYYECSFCGYRKKKEEEVICWKCGKGEMIYHDPFRR